VSSVRLSPGEPIKARLHVGTRLLPGLVARRQEPESLTDNLAGGLLQAVPDVSVHEPFELWCEQDRDRPGDLEPGTRET
jgi:hypothetical protein